MKIFKAVRLEDTLYIPSRFCKGVCSFSDPPRLHRDSPVASVFVVRVRFTTINHRCWPCPSQFLKAAIGVRFRFVSDRRCFCPLEMHPSCARFPCLPFLLPVFRSSTTGSRSRKANAARNGPTPFPSILFPNSPATPSFIAPNRVVQTTLGWLVSTRVLRMPSFLGSRTSYLKLFRDELACTIGLSDWKKERFSFSSWN